MQGSEVDPLVCSRNDEAEFMFSCTSLSCDEIFKKKKEEVNTKGGGGVKVQIQILLTNIAWLTSYVLFGCNKGDVVFLGGFV